VNPYVFIVGTTRSGTTLLQRMVDAHPQIAVVHETHWIENAEQKKQAPPASTQTSRISHGRPKASRGRLRPLQLPDLYRQLHELKPGRHEKRVCER
jgi:Sulfotransferase family